jgi:hypothetical protein
MKLISVGFKTVWMSIVSLMLATGVVTLLPSSTVHYGVLANHRSLLPWLFWAVSILFALVIVDIIRASYQAVEPS